MKYNRIQAMEDYIMNKKSCTNEELLQQFHISVQTLRRDIEELKKRNIVSKIYGGVVYLEEQINKKFVEPINRRSMTGFEQKQLIGKLAAETVNDNDVIFIDSGTTACNIVPFLNKQLHITVISHSLQVMDLLCSLSFENTNHIKGICMGGTLNFENKTFFSDTSFYPYNFNKAFISTVGITTHKGLTNTDFAEGVMKNHVMKQSDEVFLVADSSKFGVVAFNHFGDFNQINTIITDEPLNEKYNSFFQMRHIKVIHK